MKVLEDFLYRIIYTVLYRIFLYFYCFFKLFISKILPLKHTQILSTNLHFFIHFVFFFTLKLFYFRFVNGAGRFVDCSANNTPQRPANKSYAFLFPLGKWGGTLRRLFCEQHSSTSRQ